MVVLDHGHKVNCGQSTAKRCGRIQLWCELEPDSMRQVLEGYLTRVEHDPSGRAAKLYLFIRSTGTDLDQPKNVVINPYVSFGKPVIAGTGLPTRVVAERFTAGDTNEEASMIVAALPKMLRILKSNPPPFIARIYNPKKILLTSSKFRAHSKLSR